MGQVKQTTPLLDLAPGLYRGRFVGARLVTLGEKRVALFAFDLVGVGQVLVPGRSLRYVPSGEETVRGPLQLRLGAVRHEEQEGGLTLRVRDVWVTEAP